MRDLSSSAQYFRALLYPGCFFVGLTALAIGPLVPGAIAQNADGQLVAVQQASNRYSFRYVDPSTGNDANDGSSVAAPLRTITRALAIAPENTIVVLAAGTYSAASGEQFPLKMKSGVTLQGQPTDRGQSVVISGGGNYLSRSFARQNITLLGANRAGLRGVTVTNPAPQGYGLWIESTSPVISDSTFTGSTHDGVSIVGSSAPILKNNTFTQNGANGITIYGYSNPELIENTFDNTGFGINIAQNAAPRLTGNRITHNKDGIVVQGNAAPILRNNRISDNSRDGLVAISTAQPHLGNTSEAGNNQFSGNGGFDINAASTSQPIPAVGNQVGKTSGNLDRASIVAVTIRPVRQFASILPPKSIRSETRIGSDTTDTTKPAIGVPPIANPIVDSINLPLLRLPPVPAKLAPKLRPVAIPVDSSQFQNGGNGASSGRSLPVVPELRVSKPSVLGGTAPDPAAVGSGNLENTTSIPIAVPAPDNSEANPVNTTARPGGLMVADRGVNSAILSASNVLPVPSGAIPVGNTGGGETTVWSSPAPRPTFRFRVYVPQLSPEQLTQLRTIVPGAFNAVVKGQPVIQTGAFNDRAEADELVGKLTAVGLPAVVDNY
jgi:parallel beta-helix repeat protein